MLMPSDLDPLGDGLALPSTMSQLVQGCLCLVQPLRDNVLAVCYCGPFLVEFLLLDLGFRRFDSRVEVVGRLARLAWLALHAVGCRCLASRLDWLAVLACTRLCVTARSILFLGALLQCGNLVLLRLGSLVRSIELVFEAGRALHLVDAALAAASCLVALVSALAAAFAVLWLCILVLAFAFTFAFGRQVN